MAVKKSELYRSLWASCDELRGGMDASQYKDYVLVVLFVKYVSDRYGGDPDALLEVPPGGSFADLLALRNKSNIGDGTNKVIAKLAEANDLRGVIDVADFNDPDKLGKGQSMVDRLSRLFSIFDNPALDFGGNTAEGDDLLGDAYEYLMRHFATESGKSKGQFYTPAEVSRVLAAVVGVENATDASHTIYDPTCGSGSLLLKAHDRARDATGLDLSLYGQEMDNATAALAKMNMILHGVLTAEVWQDNTLTDPHWTDSGGLKKFNYVVANPPFSVKSWTSGLDPANDEFGRFPYGIPPTKNGDYAFLLHMLASLKADGKAAVILPHGVLFRGGAEAVIRREMVKRGLFKAVIGLPPNLFYGTGIPAAIIVLDRQDAARRDSVLMIDASRGFAKDGAKNRLRERDIHRIIDAYRTREDTPGYSRPVPISEIADPRNDYNLNLPRYIPSTVGADRQDLAAHLAGGIPDTDLDDLAGYWDLTPDLPVALFTDPIRPGYRNLAIPANQVSATIDADPGLNTFRDQVTTAFTDWAATHRPALAGIDADTIPKQLIHDLSESLLDTLEQFPLLDPYAVYQDLMAFWATTLRDDIDAVRADGWSKAAEPQSVSEAKDKDPVDYTIGRLRYRSAILPRRIIIDTFCTGSAQAVQTAEEQVEAAQAHVEELQAEHGGEDGLLESAVDDNGRLSKGKITAALKNLRRPATAEEAAERDMLTTAADALTALADAKKELKAAETELETAVRGAYQNLSGDDIITLAVDTAWLGSIRGYLDNELDRVNTRLFDRIAGLHTRYATTLPDLEQRTGQLTQQVDKILRDMGITW